MLIMRLCRKRVETTVLFSFWTVPISLNLTSVGCGIRWVWCLRSLYCSTNQWRRIFCKYRMDVFFVKSAVNNSDRGLIKWKYKEIWWCWRCSDKSNVSFFSFFSFVHWSYSWIHLSVLHVSWFLQVYCVLLKKYKHFAFSLCIPVRWICDLGVFCRAGESSEVQHNLAFFSTSPNVM